MEGSELEIVKGHLLWLKTPGF